MFYKNYFRYIIPSMIAFTLTGIYSIVDGFFIGQAVGDIGLAAVNLAWPVAAVTYAVGTGLGMGGSVVSSIKRGEGKSEEARKTIGTSFAMIIVASITVTLLIFCFAEPLISLMGAEGLTKEYAVIYLKTLAIGAAAQIGGCGLMPIIRSLGRPMLAMTAMVAGCIANIVLDWYFVMILGWGVKGAGLATILGEFLTAIPFVIFFLLKNNRISINCIRLKLNIAKEILKIGISPFGLSILPSFITLLINLRALELGGDIAVAAFGVIAYVMSIIQLMIQGISEGSQPMLSFNTGSGNTAIIKKTAKLTFTINILTGFAGAAVLILFSDKIAFLYNTGPETTMILLVAMPMFAATMPLYGFSRTAADYLYAINRPYSASLMVYSEGLLFMPVLILILPEVFLLTGVWACPLTTQCILLILGLYLIFRKKDIKKTSAP